jgi:crotonobetaine/carnitine-CoA ligase
MEPVTVGAVLAAEAERDPGRVAVRFGGGDLTVGAWEERARRAAHALAGLGLAPGDTCALLLPNGPDFLAAWFGISKAGLVEVPLNTALQGDLLADQLARAGCAVVVVDAALAPAVAAVADGVGPLRHLVVSGGPADVDPGRGVQVHDFDTLLAAADTSAPAVPADPYAPAGILYTSGTTGPSKGVVRSAVADFTLARTTIDIMGYGAGEVLYTAFPLYHLNAKYNSVLASLLTRSTLVLHDRFSASTFWDTCRAQGVTAFNFMGALLVMLMKQPAREDDADHRVRCAYGAPAPVAIFDDFEARFGVRLVEVYGSTELGIVTHNTVDLRVPGTCGTAADAYEVRIHDAEDRPCPPGEVGEICVRPTRASVMFSAYHGMPEATLESIRNLWFHTGDRGRADEAGRFTYVDRSKDAIRRRGENISSWEVEQCLLAHDDVAEAAVVGVPSDLTEEEVLAVVVAKPGRDVEAADLVAHCRGRLPRFAVPRYVRVVAELPKTPSQRVEKYRLREEGLAPGTYDREAAA